MFILLFFTGHFCILDELLSFYLYCCLVINSLLIFLSCLHELYWERSKERLLRGERGRDGIQERGAATGTEHRGENRREMLVEGKEGREQRRGAIAKKRLTGRQKGRRRRECVLTSHQEELLAGKPLLRLRLLLGGGGQFTHTAMKHVIDRPGPAFHTCLAAFPVKDINIYHISQFRNHDNTPGWKNNKR